MSCEISSCKEPYIKYFVRIEFHKFCQKNILPVAIYFLYEIEKCVYKTKERHDLGESKISRELDLANFEN